MSQGITRVLILGGYGNFGKRIAGRLSVLNNITILIAGRNQNKAQQLCNELILKGTNGLLEAVALNFDNPQFADDLKALSPDLVIHTGGPFQGQNYRVAEACIASKSHYIDLSDDRRFVCDISSLNKKALENDVLVISGASSVPGLSSTVIDSLIDQFSSLDEIDFAIAPGNQADRGEATVKGILSYTGHPFTVFSKGKWINQYGWMSPRKLYFNNAIGHRWLANVDIPDLELFPKRYGPLNTVNFQAGLELPLLHFGMVFMALLAKIGLVKDWSVLTRQIFRASEIFKNFGTDTGGMQINLTGLNAQQKPKKLKWVLSAENGVGPYIPIISAIILAKKLIAETLDIRGAMPCLGMYSLEEFDAEARAMGIYHHVEDYIG